jgi:hypothetical protein
VVIAALLGLAAVLATAAGLRGWAGGGARRLKRVAGLALAGALGAWHGACAYANAHPLGAGAAVLGVDAAAAARARAAAISSGFLAWPRGQDMVEIRVHGVPPERGRRILGRFLAESRDLGVVRPPAPLPFSRRRQLAWTVAAGVGACAVGLFWGRWLEGPSGARREDDEDEPPPA